MTGPGERSEQRIALAAIAGAHGVRGELRLKLFSDSLAAHENLYVGGAVRRLLAFHDGGKSAIARFEGISNRSEAEALRGSLVEVDRSALPPLGEGEYYHSDLIGLPAADQEGKPLGLVVSVENYGAGDLLEIEAVGGKRWLIPFKPGMADFQDGRILVDREFLA